MAVSSSSYVLHGYQRDFLATLAAAQGHKGDAAAALDGVVRQAMSDPVTKSAIFDAVQCVHCGSVKPAEWIATRKGDKEATTLALSAPVVEFLQLPLLAKVERVGEPPVKQVVPGARTSDASKAARCCVDWAIKEYGAVATGRVAAQELKLTLAEVCALLEDEPRALNLLLNASGQTQLPAIVLPESTPPDVDTAQGELTMAEVGKHNTVDDFWFVIHGNVYDMTEYIADHPGGFGVLKEYGGKIADEGFDANHSLAVIAGQPAVKLLGKVSAIDLAAAAEAENAEPVRDYTHVHCIQLWLARRTICVFEAPNLVSVVLYPGGRDNISRDSSVPQHIRL